MFTSKGLFSEIPCPYLEKCSLPRCIFSHEVPPPKVSSVQEIKVSSAANTGEVDLDNDDQSGPKKRRKLDDVSKPAISKPATQLTTDRKAALLAARKSALARPISPPPLRRNLPHETPSNKQLPPPKKDVQITPVPKPVAKAVDAPLKAEALIPRTVAKPPAQYNKRFALLTALHQQFVRLNSEVAKDASDAEAELVLSEQALITKALNIEESASSSAVYDNVVKGKILTYKRMAVKDWVDERKKEVTAAKARKAATIAAAAPKVLVPPNIESGLEPEDELKFLHRLYASKDMLARYGFTTTIPTDADVEAWKIAQDQANGWETCERCKSRFQVFPGRREADGLLADGGQCTYHHGKLVSNQAWSAANPRAKHERRYQCCGQPAGDSKGCVTGTHHVFKIADTKGMAAHWNFVNTPKNLEKISERPVCIDAEMGYTVYGMELLRLTATSWPSGSTIFDVLVKPLGGILDFNSLWSGISAKLITEAVPYSPTQPTTTDGKFQIVESPQAARDLLFSHISPHTPLIGHGLENDLNVCRIIHPTLIDTAILFPHSRGPPYRESLKNLTRLHLKRIIQAVDENGNPVGHDSREDANAAGDLVRFKLKSEWEKLKREGWTLNEGDFKPPTPKGASLQLDNIEGGGYLNVRESKEVKTSKAGTGIVRAPTGPRKRPREEEERRSSLSAVSGPAIPNPRKAVKKESMEEELNYDD